MTEQRPRPCVPRVSSLSKEPHCLGANPSPGADCCPAAPLTWPRCSLCVRAHGGVVTAASRAAAKHTEAGCTHPRDDVHVPCYGDHHREGSFSGGRVEAPQRAPHRHRPPGAQHPERTGLLLTLLRSHYLAVLAKSDEKVRSKRNRWPTASPHVALVPLSVRVGASASSRGELPALDPAADLILRGGWDRCRWRCQEQALGGPVPPPTAGTYSAMDGRQYRWSTAHSRLGSLRWAPWSPATYTPTICLSGGCQHRPQQCHPSPALSRFLGGRPVLSSSSSRRRRCRSGLPCPHELPRSEAVTRAPHTGRSHSKRLLARKFCFLGKEEHP